MKPKYADLLIKLMALSMGAFLVYLMGYNQGRTNGENWYAITHNGTDFTCPANIDELKANRAQITVLAVQLREEIETTGVISEQLWECKLGELR